MSVKNSLARLQPFKRASSSSSSEAIGICAANEGFIFDLNVRNDTGARIAPRSTRVIQYYASTCHVGK